MLQETIPFAALQKPSLENSVWYNGHTFSFLVEGKQTGGAFALMHCHFTKGGEPPAHYHQREDEIFYILEGEVQFHIGDKKFVAKAGDMAYAPKGIPHYFAIQTPTAKGLLLITPAGMETFFREFGTPAQTLNLPPIPEGQPGAHFFEKMLKRAEALGMVWIPEF